MEQSTGFYSIRSMSKPPLPAARLIPPGGLYRYSIVREQGDGLIEARVSVRREASL